MADIQNTAFAAQRRYSHGGNVPDENISNSLLRMTNLAASAVSLALVAGIAIWGYKLVVRDVSGLPVVHKLQGEMRVRPENPGGQFALNQGLAVNAVAAEGSAEKPADTLVLAPQPVTLADEDQPILAAMVAPEQQVAQSPAPAATVDQAVAIDDVLAEIALEANVIQALLQIDDGLATSLRPRLRPRRGAFTPAAAPVSNEIDPSKIPAGTRVAQLGAFDDPAQARSEWTKLQSRFGPYLLGKSRVVQEAQSGGRVFYRLRAMGFTDLSDARRFCSALLAENADCIPVVTK